VCDWTIELLKRRLHVPAELEGAAREAALADQRSARQVLAKVLNELLLMLHPLMPHLTEELWHGLRGAPIETLLALQPWPALDQAALDSELEELFAETIELIRMARNLRATGGLKPGQKVSLVAITTSRPELQRVLELAVPDIEVLVKAERVEVFSSMPELPRSLMGISGSAQVQLQLPEQDLAALRSRLEKDLAKAEKEIAGLAGRLANPNFADKAPAEVVAECQANLAEAQAQAQLAQQRLADLG
jgi:valyl-tRNA synthetase